VQAYLLIHPGHRRSRPCLASMRSSAVNRAGRDRWLPAGLSALRHSGVYM
jgi:hypothetical protein